MAALGAGIGTGLAGLSAATVMAPILIALRPSFTGDTGAHQATAIPLASLLEKWDVMLLCIAVATVASPCSARFANRVNNRAVGLVTGAVLTVLGGSMLLLPSGRRFPPCRWRCRHGPVSAG